MEQLITIEQLEELSQEQKNNLRDWWYASNPGRFDLYVVLYKYDDGLKYEGPFVNSGVRDFAEDFTTGEALPLLSIGQMIEIIKFKALSEFTFKHSHDTRYDYNKWDIPQFQLPDGGLSHYIIHPELRDGLWLAVKTVLNYK
ncbi:hypothetical protein BS614_04160 [Paenibacillus xylanexedens]|uniref:hypothetical protein n=1 Tax=Paenibacillus xylanexedens TaxID=528191 RepID=UPI0009382FB5|nr:hypothetical protein [Paenibacillus xylanexedens]APO43326.1 hypothetical protein BS614_04160 [Paenibacillus xylanexedens]